ncbi:hypothetical protein HBI71_022690 [Parastagonospora nodorum]|nr:hypothetical protein HBI71_022690 [Parastagonospora nodorum]
MKFFAIISALCASSLALDILQVDGTISHIEDTSLIPRQAGQCCENNFVPPCLCPTKCASSCSACCVASLVCGDDMT